MNKENPSSGSCREKGFFIWENSYIWLVMKIEFPYVTVEDRDGIIWLVFKEGADLDATQVREFVKASEKLSGGEPYLLLSDARVHLTISSEGRKVAADKKEVPNLVANAVLVNNLAVRLTANFFINFNKPHFKYRVFNDEVKALKWLKKHHVQKEPA
jgi:hypothetical protein